MSRYIAVAAIMMTVACAVQAQDKLGGTWEGETRNGSSIVLTLAVKGTALTGTLVRNGQSATLADGKVSKNTLHVQGDVERPDGRTSPASSRAMTSRSGSIDRVRRTPSCCAAPRRK